MDKMVEDFFKALIKNEKKNASFKKELQEMFDSYDEDLQKKIDFIVNQADEKDLLNEYNKLTETTPLPTDGLILYALALNPRLPDEIVRNMCFIGSANTEFEVPLFNNHKDKMDSLTFTHIYNYNRYTVISNLYGSHYAKNHIDNDIDYPYWMLNIIAKKETALQNDEKVDVGCNIFFYIKDETVIENVLNAVRNSPDSKNAIITELLNNPSISEEKKNIIFDEFGCNYSKLYNPTPYIRDAFYDSAVYTVFNLGINHRSFSSSDESRIFRIATSTLSDMASRQHLTNGMQYDLMNMLVERKDRSSDWLTSALVRATTDPRVLHLALSLKSTSDKDEAINNPHLSKEDIITVATDSKKKLDKELKKTPYPSDKHRNRLISLCQRATLTDEIYDTMLRLNHRSYGSLIHSKYTPKHILEKMLEKVASNELSLSSFDKCAIKCMIFAIDNNLSKEKASALQRTLVTLSGQTNKDSFTRSVANLITDFVKDNSETREFIKFLSEHAKQTEDEKVSNTISILLDYIAHPEKIELAVKAKEEEQNRSLFFVNNKLKRLSYIHFGPSASSKVNFYLNVKEKAKEYLILNEIKEKQEALKGISPPVETR